MKHNLICSNKTRNHLINYQNNKNKMKIKLKEQAILGKMTC